MASTLASTAQVNTLYKKTSSWVPVQFSVVSIQDSTAPLRGPGEKKDEDREEESELIWFRRQDPWTLSDTK